MTLMHIKGVVFRIWEALTFGLRLGMFNQPVIDLSQIDRATLVRDKDVDAITRTVGNHPG